MVKCPKCGYISYQYNIVDDIPYCIICGAQLEEENLFEENQPQSAGPVTSDSTSSFPHIPTTSVTPSPPRSTPIVETQPIQMSATVPQVTPSPPRSTPIVETQPIQMSVTVPQVTPSPPRSAPSVQTQPSSSIAAGTVYDEINMEPDEKELLVNNFQRIREYFHADETLIASIPVNVEFPKKGMVHEMITEYENNKTQIFKAEASRSPEKTVIKSSKTEFYEKFSYGSPEKFIASLTNDRFLLARYETRELKGIKNQTGKAHFDLFIEIPLNLLKTTDFSSSKAQEDRRIPFLGFLIPGSILTTVGLFFFFIALTDFGFLMLLGAAIPGIILLIIGLVRIFTPGFFYASKKEYLRIRYADNVLDKDSWVKLISERSYEVNKRQIVMDINKYWTKIDAVNLNKFYQLLVSNR
jgi:hypothetical protein